MLLLKYFSILQTAKSNQHNSNLPYSESRTFWIRWGKPRKPESQIHHTNRQHGHLHHLPLLHSCLSFSSYLRPHRTFPSTELREKSKQTQAWFKDRSALHVNCH